MSSDLFSVSELNEFLKDVIAAGMPRPFWICGEVQGYDRNKGRQHLFFELVEKNDQSREIKARASVVIWGGVRPKIEAILKRAENAFELKDDIEVKLLCRVDFYVPHGAVRLIVESIDPVHTLGKISQDRQKLIAELTRSGVLARNKSLVFPLVPLRIGLITAHDSAAFNDFVQELKAAGFAFSIFFVRAVMQGKGCEPSVCSAVRFLNQRPDLDVIVLTRGGGSIAELSAFDSKAIAETVAESRYPVLSAIGHEINTSITDLAAHTFVKTPTAAAQYLTDRVANFDRSLNQLFLQCCTEAQERLRHAGEEVRQHAFLLQSKTTRFFRGILEGHIRTEELCKNAARAVILQSRINLTRYGEHLNRTIHLRFNGTHIKIAALEKIVEIASPRKIFRRGFSITRGPDNRVIKSVGSVSTAMCVTTELEDGRIASTIVQIEKADRHE